MQALYNLNADSLLDTFIAVFVAFVLGSPIRFERQVRQRTAGLRTNTLVAVGAAVFVAWRTTSTATVVRCGSWPTSCLASASSALAPS